MEIDGLVYMLNQAGVALAQANGRIAQLETALAESVERASTAIAPFTD